MNNTTEKHVNSCNDIPHDDLEKIRQRLLAQINLMSAADMKIASQSEASLKKFIGDLFKAIAQLFGYILGSVTGIFEAIGAGAKAGWLAGFNAGRGN